MRKKTQAPSEEGASPAGPAPAAAELLPAAEIERHTGDPDFMTSLARGLAVIRAFEQGETQLTVMQISHRTGLPRAAVRRCLHTLECLSYVAAHGRAYSLRPRVVSLGHMYLRSTPLVVHAQPVLDRIAHQVGESCSLAVLDGDEILYVGHSSRAPLLGINLQVGSRLPAYCTANGRVLLAGLAPQALREHLARIAPRKLTPKTVTGRRALAEIVRRAQADGYAVNDQETYLDVRSIAVPVRDLAGQVVASMSISVPAVRVAAAELQRRYLPLLLEAAGQLR